MHIMNLIIVLDFYTYGIIAECSVLFERNGAIFKHNNIWQHYYLSVHLNNAISYVFLILEAWTVLGMSQWMVVYEIDECNIITERIRTQLCSAPEKKKNTLVTAVKQELPNGCII